jgi:DNA topoisomerase-1
MVIKHGRFGRFVACSGYPECKTTKPVTLGIKCPQDSCKGEIVQRRSKRGKFFYGCSAYPDCTFVLWQRPVAEACPTCQAPFIVERAAKGRSWRSCAKEGCDWKSEVETTVA